LGIIHVPSDREPRSEEDHLEGACCTPKPWLDDPICSIAKPTTNDSNLEYPTFRYGLLYSWDLVFMRDARRRLPMDHYWQQL